MYPVPGLVNACPMYWTDRFSVVLKPDLTDEEKQYALQSLTQLPGAMSAKVIRQRFVYVQLNGLVDIETVVKSAKGVAGVELVEMLSMHMCV